MRPITLKGLTKKENVISIATPIDTPEMGSDDRKQKYEVYGDDAQVPIYAVIYGSRVITGSPFVSTFDVTDIAWVSLHRRQSTSVTRSSIQLPARSPPRTILCY